MAILIIHGPQTARHAADEIGAKAANLARMASLGLPVPPAFVLPIQPTSAVLEGGNRASQGLAYDLAQGIRFLEEATGRGFGDPRRPLLVSVRSGAARSMPGMLDTLVDVGCTTDAALGLVRLTGNPRFAWDCRRRFIESYASTVLAADGPTLSKPLADLLAAEHVDGPYALDSEAMERLARDYSDALAADDQALPETAMDQLVQATLAVYRSWSSERATTYRRVRHLEDLAGTAVSVQAMVYGNRGLSSGTGVALSRDCSTGEPIPVIDVLFAAQGEDIVSGRRTPETEKAFAARFPDASAALRGALTLLERDFREVQDVEFTVEEERLWLLQTRTAKRTAEAALRFAVDFVHEELITPAEALERLHDVDLPSLVRTRFADESAPIARASGASSGVAVGRAAFDVAQAKALASHGDAVILLRPTISTSDIDGFAIAAGIVTAAGGRTAHAALVARQLGKPCVVGCADLVIDADAGRARLGPAIIEKGGWISIDGSAGTLYLGRREIVTDRPERALAEVESWRRQRPTADAAA